MFRSVDQTLERLLRDRVPLRTEGISFDTPSESYEKRLPAPRTLNLYLYDPRENHDLRMPDWSIERQPNGSFIKQRPPARIDLCYMITVWSTPSSDGTTAVLDEHDLLGRVLATLLR